jgi:hypothetical protein
LAYATDKRGRNYLLPAEVVVRRPRIRLLLVAACLLAFGATLFATLHRSASVHASGSALAARDFAPYLHRSSNDALADPINLICQGGTPRQAARSITQVLGWTDVSGSSMTFQDGGARHPAGWQLGVDLGSGDRLHIRIEGDTNLGGNGYELAGVHHDTKRACGHVGGDFDASRDLVARAYAADGYTVTYLALDNTQASQQCDGSDSAGDGQVAVIDLASSTLPLHPPAVPIGRDAGIARAIRH